MADDFAQLVKQQASIVKIVEGYVRLKKAGAQNFSGLCPFHKEKSPSFSVHEARQFYHCFGCGESGDVFSFVQKVENVGFPEAVRFVAQKCGIPLPKRDFATPEEAEESRQRRKLLELHETASQWFQEQLLSPEAARAREYLSSRGLSRDAIRTFGIGYAPDSFNALRDRLQPLAPPELLRLSGLLSAKEQPDGSQGSLYARFRKRITFPICAESGRVIAFTSRALDSAEDAGPKYLNSPETPLYSKGQVLFNLDKAKQSIRQLDFAVLVEGQMDCITAYMAGVRNVLATSGTAFTAMQAQLLRRHTKRVIVNFDPDAAGANAAEKSIALLLEADFEIKVLTLEGGVEGSLDPDRFIRQRGIQAYVSAVTQAKRHSDYLIDRAMQLFPPHTAENKSKAIHYLLPHIRRASDPILRDGFAMDAAQKLGIDSALVREGLKEAGRRRRERVISSHEVGLTAAERILLLALCSSPGSGTFLRAARALEEKPELMEGLRGQAMLTRLLNRQGSDPLNGISDPAEKAALTQILLLEEEEGVGSEQIDAALDTLEFRSLEQRQRGLRAEIAQAERQGDWAHVAGWTVEKLKVDRKLKELGAKELAAPKN